MINSLLADKIQIAPSGGFSGIGTLKTPSSSGAFFDFSKIISMAIGVMTIIAFIWFIFILITGAIGIMNSGGDKQAAESSKKRITNGLVGLIVVVVSMLLLELIGRILGINYLNVFYLLNCVVSGCTT